MKPDLGLSAEILSTSGRRFRWDSATVDSGNLLRGLNFSTRRGDGFANASCTLTRRIDRDYEDLGLFDEITLIGNDGFTAYEGRLSSPPRSFNESGHQVTPQFVGHSAHMRDRKAQEIYIDRDLSRWGLMNTSDRMRFLGALHLYDPQVISDPSSYSVVETAFKDELGKASMSAAYYYAPSGTRIGKLYYEWLLPSTGINLSGSDVASWKWEAWIAHDNGNHTSTATYTPNLRGPGPGSGTLVASTPGEQAVVDLQYGLAGGGVPGAIYPLHWKNLAVYGDHGLPIRGSGPGGLYASDVIRHVIAKYCPKLNTNGVQDTTFPIPHLVFYDRTDPYDILLDVNKYHLWDLAVWENKTVHFRPVDMTDYDWEVRLSDFGVSIELQGDSTEELANGIVVQFDNVATGMRESLTPADHPELADTSATNPANLYGIQRWTEITLSTPCTREAASALGQLALVEYNQPKAPGSISLRGHIRDRAGNWQQGWKVRAGDRIAITDHPNSRPRMIQETSWDNDSKSLSISVDSQFKRLDAMFDRIATAVQAANISQ